MELKGYSGCQVSIIDIKGEKKVKKISFNVDYNERLKAQKEKQVSLELEGFKKCNICKDGYEDGFYYFIMDYINGRTFAESIETLDLKSIKEFTNQVMLNMFPFENDNVEAGKLFLKKINSIKNSIQNPTYEIVKAIKMLENFTWCYVVKTKCHGDLTLQNILIQDNQLYLIDCLDSFYDSWMIDVAKLLQDVDVMWSFREDEILSSNLIIRLTIMRDLIIEKVLTLEHADKLLETIYYILLLNLLRIYPYIKDEATESFLNQKIEYVMNKIEKKLWRG